MRTPQKLKEWTAEDEREIRWFWRERFCGFGFHSLGCWSLSVVGAGTLVEGGPLANFKSTLVCPQESIVEIQCQLQQALLRLSAMLSQYFTRCSMRVYDSPGNVIETHSTRTILNHRDA
jgi:hypothetical protein